MAEQQRISKILSQRGVCSRREAERLIEAGQVTVDGVVVREQGTKASLKADIQIAGRGQNWLDSRVTVVVNKPKGIVSTQPEGSQVPAWTLLTAERVFGDANPEVVERIAADPYYLHVAGRLDRDSRGLLVLSSDGRVVRAITGGNAVTKTYQVTVDRDVNKEDLAVLRGPQHLDGKRLKPMQITQLGKNKLRFELVEGKKHQIRRVCRAANLEVTDLLRQAVGPWKLGKLPEGSWELVDGDMLLK